MKASITSSGVGLPGVLHVSAETEDEKTLLRIFANWNAYESNKVCRKIGTCFKGDNNISLSFGWDINATLPSLDPEKIQLTKEEKEKLMESAEKGFDAYLRGYKQGTSDAAGEYGKILDEILIKTEKLYNADATVHELLVFIKGKMPPKISDNSSAYNAVINLPVVIKNVIYLSKTIIQKRVESCILSSQLYRLFREQLGNVTNDIFPDTCEFEGIEIIRDPKEIFMRFSYKEDRKPREFILRIDLRNNVQYGKLLKEGEKPNGDYKHYLPRDVIKVREVME